MKKNPKIAVVELATLTMNLNKRIAFTVTLIILAGMIVSYEVLNLPTCPPTSISVCQSGYDRDSVKIALVLLHVDKRLENTFFYVLNAETNETVYTGHLTYQGIYWNQPSWRNDTIYVANFTDLTTEGEFRLETNGRISCPFKIRTDNWFYWLDEMVAFYRFQRCGDNTTKFINYCDDATPSSMVSHDPCHMDDAIWNDSGTLIHFNGTGGWHDAGDNNKYGSNTAFVDSMLYLTYHRLKSASYLDQDHNRVPDILEEAKWGSDYLIKQVDFTGGPIFDVIELHANPYLGNYPTIESGRYGETRDENYTGNPFKTEQAYKTAGCLALACRAWKNLDAEYAEKCLVSAQKAWNWAQANPNNTGGWYAGNLEGNKFFAAVELYLATQNTAYFNLAVQRINQLTYAPATWWGDLSSIGLTELYPNTTGSLRTRIYDLLKGNADSILNAWMQNPYYINTQTIGNWGSNGGLAHNMGDVLRFYELSGNTTYMKAAERAIGWFFGANPWNISFVSGIGVHYALYVFSSLDNDSSGKTPVIIPGTLVGGPLNDPAHGYTPAPWYEDLSRAQDPWPGEVWRYQESDIEYPTDLIYAMVFFSH
jgi:endoglucanase